MARYKWAVPCRFLRCKDCAQIGTYWRVYVETRATVVAGRLDRPLDLGSSSAGRRQRHLLFPMSEAERCVLCFSILIARSSAATAAAAAFAAKTRLLQSDVTCLYKVLCVYVVYIFLSLLIKDKSLSLLCAVICSLIVLIECCYFHCRL